MEAISNEANKGNEYNDRKLSTNKIEKKTAKEIRENFAALHKGLLSNDLAYLKQNDPNIKKILCIPELQNFVLEKINADHILALEGSTAFNGNLRQLLLNNGIDKNRIKHYGKYGIVISFYGATLQLSIRQKKLSS